MYITPERILNLLIALPIFLISLTLHEFMHAWAADRMGDSTPRLAGRLTIDPRPHIDPLGLLFFIIGALSPLPIFFGWAKPVPVNYYNFRNPRRDFALVAISGPGSNFMQAVVWYLIWLFLNMTHPLPAAVMHFALAFVSLGVIINVVLLTFNLIPIPPLDGSRILTWLLPPRQAAYVDRIGRYGFFILIFLAITGILWMIYYPMLSFVLRLFPGISPI